MTSTRLHGFDLPERAGSIPSTHAHQCDVCHGIAYNPICPYCADEDEEDEAGEPKQPAR